MLCEKNECTGCFACHNICPKNAIEMIEDEYGYIYPHIIEEKCIKCNACKSVCINSRKNEFNMPSKCFAARVIDTDKLKKSTSGGIATILSEQILKLNGVVYGAAYTENCSVNHVRIDKLGELHRLQGSKYVHSYINDTYKNIKKDLVNKKKVLFIGTPCQLDGLKAYLKNDYEDLYLVDIICHGVPSQKFLKEEVNRLIDTIDIDRVDFRDKTFDEFTFSLNKEKKIVFYQEWAKSPYFYTFMKAITYRENCYSCKYAKKERLSDMMIGDFWGLGKDSKFYNERNKGISVVFVNSDKGNKLFELIEEYIETEERQVEEAVNGNDQLREPSIKTSKVIKFKMLYKNNNDFFKTYKKICRKNYYKQILKSNKLVKKILKIMKEVKNGKK